MKRYRLPVIGLVLVVLTVGVATVAARAERSVEYIIRARDGRLIRQVTGEVISDVNGVPAEPVDSFLWDGEGIVPIRGSVRMEIDPVANTGTIDAQWTDENGRWRLRQSTFVPPSHPTGLKVGANASDTILIVDDPVTANVYLHGNTGAGGPVLPTVFNLLATWGPAEVTLNGQPFENTFDGPVPSWVAHTMTTEGVRDENGQVLTLDGDVYNMMNPGDSANGKTYDDTAVFHLVFHEAPGPMTENVPPPHSFFYHVTFQDVTVKINGNS